MGDVASAYNIEQLEAAISDAMDPGPRRAIDHAHVADLTAALLAARASYVPPVAEVVEPPAANRTEPIGGEDIYAPEGKPLSARTPTDLVEYAVACEDAETLAGLEYERERGAELAALVAEFGEVAVADYITHGAPLDPQGRAEERDNYVGGSHG